jgi:cyclopropane fatty-acyl-phospholipid synthase-like methyltransferase
MSHANVNNTISSSKASPQEIVERGYNRIALEYTEWAKSARKEERQRYTDFLITNMHPGAKVLELGCGAGDPTTRQLAKRFAVTGVDISEEQLRRATINIPEATFIHADMTRLKFASASFEAVAAFYAITHVPRKQHAALIVSISDWLTPGGLFVASMSAGSLRDSLESWFGVPMYFNGYSAKTNVSIVKKAGLKVLKATRETALENGRPVTFLWIIAQKV